MPEIVSPFQGCGTYTPQPQGVALGCLVVPFQGGKIRSESDFGFRRHVTLARSRLSHPSVVAKSIPARRSARRFAVGSPTLKANMQPAAEKTAKSPVTSTAKVVIISSAMFVFLSYWRVAAVVLCDLASTAFYIGGIVEHSIGPAAPWFILGVMLFSYAVRSVYIESCSMFVRGGVYRIVKEALGRTLAKVAVSALLFDYVLTGPISGVSAGQYIMSLAFELLTHFSGTAIAPETRDFWKAAGSVVIACAITLYFFRLNVVGIHESSDKALKIMIVTTIMGVTILGWSLLTLATDGPRNALVFQPTFTPQPNPATGALESPLGFLEGTQLGELLLSHWDWLSVIGGLGFFIAFGHAVLAMSGEETLAQIYREVRGRSSCQELQAGGVHRLRVQPAVDRRNQRPGGGAYPRRRSDGEI